MAAVSAFPHSLASFNALVRENQDAAYTLACFLLGSEQEAQRATESALAAAYRGWRQNGDGSFLTWLLRCIAEACQGKKANGGPAVEGLSSELCDSLARLPFRERLAVALVDVIGLSYSDAAAVADSPVGKVRAWLAEGRARLARLA